jgi:hypothetical protein
MLSKPDKLLELQDKLNMAKQAAMALRLSILGIGATSGMMEIVSTVEGQAIRLFEDLDVLSLELGEMRGEEASSHADR